MNMISNACELTIDELEAVSGGDSKTVGQIVAKVFLGKELPDPPILKTGGAELAFEILGVLAL
jgi:bacteriocin-like protein